MNPLPLISRHAIDRYRQRVDAAASPAAATRSIADMLHEATVCSRPRHWMRVAATAPGTRYVYSAARPDVCLVVADGVVVTVHSRRVCAAWALRASQEVSPRQRPIPYRRERRAWAQEAA